MRPTATFTHSNLISYMKLRKSHFGLFCVLSKICVGEGKKLGNSPIETFLSLSLFNYYAGGRDKKVCPFFAYAFYAISILRVTTTHISLEKPFDAFFVLPSREIRKPTKKISPRRTFQYRLDFRTERVRKISHVLSLNARIASEFRAISLRS